MSAPAEHGVAPRHREASPAPAASVSEPSSFYRVWLWKLGLTVVRLAPRPLFRGFCRAVAAVYFQAHSSRREMVIQNLLPAVGNQREQARQIARRLFGQFALKLADLWRYESGQPVEVGFEPGAWEVIQACLERGRGLLLLTPHLGNWELGGPSLASRGVRLLVLTQPEPGRGLTELRAASRARWGIETLVIGGDGFAFVEVIKRLQSGAAVALLVDRPVAPSFATVELFGRPFRASVAAAELARATGCALIGVTVANGSNGYQIRLLPEFVYDRQTLGNREARRELTQKIMRAFEPAIRQHLDQWYHFIPIWPGPDQGPASGAEAQPGRP